MYISRSPCIYTLPYSQASDLGILLCLSGGSWGASLRVVDSLQPQQLQGPALFQPRSCDQPVTGNRGNPKAGPFLPSPGLLLEQSTPNLPWHWQRLFWSCSTASDSSHPVSHPSSAFTRSRLHHDVKASPVYSRFPFTASFRSTPSIYLWHF